MSGGISASGMTKAELFRIGYYEDNYGVSDFRFNYFEGGLYLELKASGFINTLGKKWEIEKYYKKVELINKNN